ncbi:FAD-dependent oxidoreductase [Pseudonocardia sp.]|uniref:FAD-dependent oxidoreductase n=1 Tax=Pseudonocardia sp. TaxID=60912 RepID=UPI003D1492AA
MIAPLGAPAFAPDLDHMLAVRRADLHTVLLDAVTTQPGARLRVGTTVVGAEPDGTVVTAGGERLAADLAVGFDGVHSAVRTSGGFPARVRATGQVYLRGLVPRASIAAEPGETWAPAGIFGGAPVDADTWYFYASATAPGVAEAVTARDLAALRRLWERGYPEAVPLLERLHSFDDLLVNDVVRVDCARWYDGRRVLGGDAAHAMAPTAGQGANSALVDAAVLVGRLAAATTVEDAPADYDRLRRPAVARVQNRADLLSRLAHQRNPAVRWLRDVVLRAAGGRRAGDRVAREAQQVDPVALRELVRRLSGADT